MRTKEQLISILLDWSNTFIRLSLFGFNRFTRSAGLSLGQMTVMMHLYYQGPDEVTHFSDMLQITVAGASQMIERMVQLGVVRRSESPDDRRVRLVELTGQGREIVQQSITARQAWVQDLVETLAPDERDAVYAALKILNQKAEQMDIRQT